MQLLSMAEAEARLLSRLTPDAPRTLIALAGQPGSGKSTLASALAAAVTAAAGPDSMIVLSMDGFHLTKAQLRQMPDPDAALARRGAPWTFDAAALASRLQAIRAGARTNAVFWPGFAHGVGDPVEDALEVKAQTQVILVEGLYLLHPSDGWETVGQSFDERWYLDTPLKIARERLTRRHMSASGLTRAQADTRIALSDALNAEIVSHSRPFADFLLRE